MCELQLSFQDSGHRSVTHLSCMLFCLLPKIQQEIRKVKVNTVCSYADYGDCSFPNLIWFTLAVFFFLSTGLSIPDTLNFSEKIRIQMSFLTFYGLTKKRQDTWKAGASFYWSLDKLPAAVLYIMLALWMSLFLLDTYLAQIQKVAWEMVFTTDLAERGWI